VKELEEEKKRLERERAKRTEERAKRQAQLDSDMARSQQILGLNYKCKGGRERGKKERKTERRVEKAGKWEENIP
jgi:hypothetical protein